MNTDHTAREPGGPGATTAAPTSFEPPPGTEPPGRWPRLRAELLGCAWRGHNLVGTDADRVEPGDHDLVREGRRGTRWHRCLRCDAWLVLPAPTHPDRRRVPTRPQIRLPLRGRPLRSRCVLRVIAVDRWLHFLVLALAAAAVFAVVEHQQVLREDLGDATSTVQTIFGGDVLAQLTRVLSQTPNTLVVIGVAVAALAVVELVEGIGLWRGRRWAEYVTFAVTTALLIPEIVELTSTVTPGKIATFAINLAVVVYLLLAKRLFGLRGGAAAEKAQHDHDVSWAALDRHLPEDNPRRFDQPDPTGPGGS